MTTFKETDWLCLGIDPGASGAYSLIDSDLNIVSIKSYGSIGVHKNTQSDVKFNIPNIFDFGVDVFNEAMQTYNILDTPVYIAIEAVTPPAMTSKKGAFNFGFYYGLQLAAATRTGRNITLVPPMVWQTYICDRYAIERDDIARQQTKEAIGWYIYRAFGWNKLFLNRAGNINWNKTDSMGIAMYLRGQLKAKNEVRWMR